jgi:hypothetical protein
MERLITVSPKNRERIFPYIGGEEVNESPTHAHHRFAINFEDWPLQRMDVGGKWADASDEQRKEWLHGGIVPVDYSGPVAADFPELLEIVQTRVKPDRLTDKRENYRRIWWQYGERRPGLMRALKSTPAVFVISRVTQNVAFVRLSSDTLPSDRLTVIPVDNWGLFAVLQSRVHEIWARFFGSSLRDDLMYAPVDCFETYPFPLEYDISNDLSSAGESYYNTRAKIMQARGRGITAVYNLFNDPECDVKEIVQLRTLHSEIDAAVLRAYGWNGVLARCSFVREFDDADEDEENGHPGKKKYRYRWSDETRDDVLARLLDMNHQRAVAEGQVVVADTPTASDTQPRKSKQNARTKRPKHDSTSDLFPADQEEA